MLCGKIYCLRMPYNKVQLHLKRKGMIRMKIRMQLLHFPLRSRAGGCIRERNTERLSYSPVLLLSLGRGCISICFIRAWLFNETLGLLLQEKPWSPRKWTRICRERRRKPGAGDKKPSRRLSPCDGHERKAVLFHVGAGPAPTALQWQQPAVPMGLATVSTQWWKYNFTVSRDTGETVRVHEYCSKGI